MKIEIGESLFYSWLRHVKRCQIVQTNWKISSEWSLKNEDMIEKILKRTDEFFLEKYNYKIYKQNSSLKQILRQSECDILGICINDNKIYAVDVAFHEFGLNYGKSYETISRVIKKCIRTSMCIYGYFDLKSAEIIFASPKIHNHILNNLIDCFDDINLIMQEFGFEFKFILIANDDFSNLVLNPILDVGANVADTAELFMRSYKMLCMFDKNIKNLQPEQTKEKSSKTKEVFVSYNDDYHDKNTGRIAEEIMGKLLISGKVSEEEIMNLQNKTYSKQCFKMSTFPILVLEDSDYKRERYYKTSILINGSRYKLCSQWTNRHRGHLIDWIKKYK